MAKLKTDSPLRNLRRTRTLTQGDLARLVEVTQDVISRAERGHIQLRPDLQARIAAVLGTTREEIFPVQADEAVAS